MDRQSARRRRQLATATMIGVRSGNAGGDEVHTVARIEDVEQSSWKQERLAERHDYFSRLDKAFVKWRQVAIAQRQRRQRVIAACRVGARFFQRLYWSQWREYTVNRRRARLQAVERLRRMHHQIMVHNVLLTWRLHCGQMKQTRGESHDASEDVTTCANCPNAQLAFDEHHLEVRGIHLNTPAINRPARARAISTGNHPRHQQRQTPLAIPGHDVRVKALQGIVVRRTQRDYLKYWQELAKVATRALITEMYGKADQFRLKKSLTRWRRGFTGRADYQQASRRAVFFLYYSLTKSSLDRMRRFTNKQRYERGLTVTLATCIRRDRLRGAFRRWRQRLNAKLIFSHWRNVAQGATQDQHPQLSGLAQAVQELTRQRLLRQVFVGWLKQFARRSKSRVLQRVLDGPVYKLMTASAFHAWRQRAQQHATVDKWVNNHQREVLKTVWRTWTQLAQEKERLHQLNRTARRFNYHRTLQKAFTNLKMLPPQRREASRRADELVLKRRVNHQRRVFEHWRKWLRSRQRRSDLSEQAARCYTTRVVKLVLSEWKRGVLTSKKNAQAAEARIIKRGRRLLQTVIDQWRSHATRESERSHDLAIKLEAHLAKRALVVKRHCFQTLHECSRRKISRRLVLAQARGQYQTQLMRGVLDQWSTAVTRLKWEHIFKMRALHFHRAKVQRVSFAMWKTKASSLRSDRAKTIAALHHWKRAREKQALDAWKRYVMAKNEHRERMHAALEYRHRAHVRDGLAHWMAGAAYLAEQRTKRTIANQATHRERVWRRVRVIATHWRFITAKRRQRQSAGTDRTARIQRRDALPFDGTLDLRPHRLQHVQRAPATTQVPRTSTSPRSQLSEFVMLPRNRPRPRKPIELIIESDHVESGQTENPVTCEEDTLRSLNLRYGFQFPLTGAEPVLTKQAMSAASPAEAPWVSEWSVDELEQRLLSWQDRRQKLKQLQQALADFRALLREATDQGNLRIHERDQMKARLESMEQQEAISRKRWEAFRPEIERIARRIKAVRSAATPA